MTARKKKLSERRSPEPGSDTYEARVEVLREANEARKLPEDVVGTSVRIIGAAELIDAVKAMTPAQRAEVIRLGLERQAEAE